MPIAVAITTMSCWDPLLLSSLAAGILFFFFLLHRGIKGKEKEKRSSRARTLKMLPPDPKGFPILGTLPMLGHLPHQTLNNWAKRYGPIMYMKVGQFPTIVVSSPQAAQQFLKTHDGVFASRPITEIGRLISYNYKSLSFTPYGAYWRNIRKLCTLELLSNIKIESLRPVRKEELGLVVGSLKEVTTAHAVVDMTTKVAALTKDITCRMVLGKTYMEESLGDKGDKGFKAVIDEVMHLAGAFNIAEYIPWTRDLDLQGLGRRMRVANHAFDVFVDRIIDEHVKDRDEKRQIDFVDFMLSVMESNDNEFQFDRSNIKAIMLEMILAATDTTFTTIDWALSELMKHPSTMKKAQQELEEIVGIERMVDELDLVKLDYLDMVIKESMRLHPPAPLIHHESMEDCTVLDFHIPKGSRILVNAWAIGRDPDSWPNHDEVDPERFTGSNVDVRGRDFQLLPFGSGRRGCPGMQLGLTIVRLLLAQLIHCFDWELPIGMSPANLDMTEKYSIVMPRAHHLLAIPTYRLRDSSPSIQK